MQKKKTVSVPNVAQPLLERGLIDPSPFRQLAASVEAQATRLQSAQLAGFSRRLQQTPEKASPAEVIASPNLEVPGSGGKLLTGDAIIRGDHHLPRGDLGHRLVFRPPGERKPPAAGWQRRRDSRPRISTRQTGGDMEPTLEQKHDTAIFAGGCFWCMEPVFDPARVSYQELLAVFWRNIDPTTRNRQFCDFGNQYQSAIF
jgi:hypothetical protein